MFGYKRKLQEQRDELQKEKEELLRLKEIMESSHPKIDITYVYVFEEHGFSYIVESHATKIRARLLNGKGPMADGYESTLVDIFTKKIVYKKTSLELINMKEKIFEDETFKYFHYADITPICEKEPNLLAYTDKKVPLYVLQRLYYKLNNIDLSSPLFELPQTQKTLKKEIRE